MDPYLIALFVMVALLIVSVRKGVQEKRRREHSWADYYGSHRKLSAAKVRRR